MSGAVTEGSGRTLAGKYLTFMLAGERYGLEILKVQEIIGIANITWVPRVSSALRGVINLRGKIIPVVDLRVQFGIPARAYDERTCIIVVSLTHAGQSVLVGIIVDTVLEVLSFTTDKIEPAPDYGSQVNSRFIIGMGVQEGTLNVLIDIESALASYFLTQGTS